VSDAAKCKNLHTALHNTDIPLNPYYMKIKHISPWLNVKAAITPRQKVNMVTVILVLVI
jgi:hypothetical protein